MLAAVRSDPRAKCTNGPGMGSAGSVISSVTIYWAPSVCPYTSGLFFFQAEDGIRDYKVTGVQTCALPICRIAFDDEELAAVAGGVGAIAQFAGKIQARGGRALARHFGLRRAARLARPRREDDARDDRLRDGDVMVQPVLERRTNDAVDAGHELGIVESILG